MRNRNGQQGVAMITVMMIVVVLSRSWWPR